MNYKYILMYSATPEFPKAYFVQNHGINLNDNGYCNVISDEI